MKKLIAIILVAAMMLGILAGCSNDADTQATYTYNTYMSSLATNWNPHTWELSNDDTVRYYLMTPFVDITVADSESGEYQWIFVAATDIQDVTADHQDDLVKYGASETDATEGYVYEISLREGLCWEDGTVINADSYIYSMKQLLDPSMQNYRANLYYSGASAVAGAAAYYYQGKTAYATQNADAAGNLTVTMADLVKGDDGAYYTADGNPVAFAIGAALDCWLSGETLQTYYEYGYIAEDYWTAIAALTDDNGFMVVTDDSIAALYAFTGSEDWGFESEEDLAYYLYIGQTYDACEYDDTVGVYKVDDYTIRYVCQTAYDYYYFLTSMTDNWLVNEEMYESCKTYDEESGLTTSDYNTSVETTVSYGPYKLVSLEDEKQMVMEQNEKYFEYTADKNGNLTSTSEIIGFKVDGEYVNQYQMQKVVIDVMTDDAAKLAFLSGELDDWAVSAEDAVTFSTSEQLYKVDETYTMRLFFNTNMEALQAMDNDGTNTNGVVLSNYNFRKALSLAIDRTEFVSATAGYKPAYSMINSLYFYDVYEDPSSIYRNTDEAMQAVCNLYGVEYGEGTAYATLEEAYASVTGYNLTEAQALMAAACDELVAAGLYTEGADITLTMAWAKGSVASSDLSQIALLNEFVNAAAEGSGFGHITLNYVDNLSNRYADVAAGTYAIGWGAWGGAAFYPFTLFQVYCDPDMYDLHEAGCWDPATETLTLTVNGEEVTMTWQEWSGCMEGTGVYANADNETKLQILADIEENFLQLYYCIPIASTTSCSMLSYKLSYYTENYSIMYGFGGTRLIKFNYSDAEWAEYVSSQGGTVSY